LDGEVKMSLELDGLFPSLDEVIILKRKNVNCKGRVFKYRKKRINVINQDFFDIINTEEKAYWLGFLYADGCIYLQNHERKNNRICSQYVLKIGISKKDEIHLQKFADIFNVKLHYRQNGNSIESYVQIYDEYLYNRLYELGMRNRNLNIIKNNVSNDLFRHFIRGLFDGDGCITIFSQKQKHKDIVYIREQCIISFACFSYGFANDLQDIICNEIKLLKNKIVKHKNSSCWYPSWGAKQDIKSFKDWLYNDATVCLDRKKQKFDNILFIDKGKSMFKKAKDGEVSAKEYNDWLSQKRGYKDFNEYKNRK